jgi:hypothetical protein
VKFNLSAGLNGLRLWMKEAIAVNLQYAGLNGLRLIEGGDCRQVQLA